MPQFCDVALPVPLDQAFTYAVPPGMEPRPGARVLVPFRTGEMAGVALRLHDTPPAVEAKPLLRVLDAEPILSADLLQLAEWVAHYYLSPIGEVLRTMLPLAAEVQRENFYRITEAGMAALVAGAEHGSTRRTRQTADARRAEYSVLDALSHGEPVSARRIAAQCKVNRAALEAMVRRGWIARAQRAAAKDASRTERIAVLKSDVRLPKLNAPQQALLAELAAANGRLPVAALRERGLSFSSLRTLEKHGALKLEDSPLAFHLTSLRASETVYELTEQQRHALTLIGKAAAARTFQPVLLYGVTGSGKTAVYIAAMQDALARGRSALLLVPEIGLTPAITALLYRAFGSDVALLHSSLTAKERAEQWHRIRRGEARVVVGTRSAVFAPLADLGLILVDEEHDSSYKQEELPRYNARDTAVMRGKLAGVPVVLGSATPSLESWVNTERGRYALAEMPLRVADRPLPEVERIDMRLEYQETKRESLFSRRVVEEITATLERGEQAIVLLNRRGYSAAVLCRDCGQKLECVNCSLALTHHKPLNDAVDVRAAGQRLQCHTCGYMRTVPKVCPHCGKEHLYFLGAGSQQGEERLQEIFPNARIGRMDRDTVRGRHDMERLLARLHAGEINLLVGTQMIAKGHDIHGVTTVGVVGADFALSLPDFRAAERVFQLLTQVSGRAGRGDKPGRVIVQTYYPEHYAIECAAAHDFRAFAQKELHFRRSLFYPPFVSLANVVLRSPKLEQVSAWVVELQRWFLAKKESGALGGVRVLGPASAPVARSKGWYRFHFVLKSQSREALGLLLRELQAHASASGMDRGHLAVDVDAVSLM